MVPEITIGMPVYNEGKYIRETLESLLNQTYEKFHVIISDNNSLDETYDICKEFAKKDKRIKVFKQKENIGALNNFRFVLELAQTPLFIWLSGHDLWHPELLEKLINSFIKSKDEKLILVYPRTILKESNIEYHENYDTTQIDNPIERFKFIVFNLRTCNIFYGLWKTEALKKIKFKKIIGLDNLLLANASLIGKFKKEKEALLIRRQNYTYSDYFSINKEYDLKKILYSKFMFFRQLEILKDTKITKIYKKVIEILLKSPISEKIPDTFKNEILSIILTPEEIKYVLEHVKLCLNADKFGVRISQIEKIYISLWTIYTLVYKLYITMPYDKKYLLYGKFAEKIYRIKNQIVKNIKK